MSAISESRERMGGALRSDSVLPSWRIHDTPPANIAAPCAWVDMPTVVRRDLSARGATVVVVSWPVMLVVDGRDDAQVRQLDEGIARLWDAIDALERTEALTVTAQPFDVGGPSLRGVVLTAEETILARTLCPPALLSMPVTTP